MSTVTVNMKDLFKTEQDYKKYVEFCETAGFKPYAEKDIEKMKKGERKKMK